MDMLKEFFQREKIEYFSVLPYSDCRVLRPDIMSRENFLPKSVILYLIPYYSGETVNISKYAASRDYHIYVSEANARLIEHLKGRYPENSYKGYGDKSPIDERWAALSTGLGLLGENGLLINEKYGSYVFIAEVICDIEPKELGEFRHAEAKGCMGCGRCKAACPTGRLNNKELSCLSEITQRKGELSADEVELMRKCGTVWGCDECQSVCPYNKNPIITPIPFFVEQRISELSFEYLSSMNKEEFSERAFSWRGRKTILRNLNILNDKAKCGRH